MVSKLVIVYIAQNNTELNTVLPDFNNNSDFANTENEAKWCEKPKGLRTYLDLAPSVLSGYQATSFCQLEVTCFGFISARCCLN